MAWNSIGRAISIFTRLGVPQIRRAAPAASPTAVGRVLEPALQQAQGTVVLESDRPVAPPVFLELEAQTIPTAVSILVTNDVKVDPSLLLNVFPWQSMLEQPPVRVATGEQVSREIAKLYEDLQRWNKLGHLINPSHAVEICKRFASWMSLRDIERVLHPKQGPVLDTVRQVLSADLDVDKLAKRHDQILSLLAEDRVQEAYTKAQGALRSLESAHRLIESVRLRVMEAQRRVSAMQWRAMAAAGAGVVIGLACEYFASVPEVNLPIIEGAVRSAALSGSVLCLSTATALYLCSDQFSSYLEEVRNAHEAHLRVHHRLNEDVNACLDKGFTPQGLY